jgi:biopolymer transport protein ExbD
MKAPLVQGDAPLTRINVTPIIDVALVLVIILLITAPMLSVADLEIELPQAHARDAEDPVFVSITLGPGGEIAVDDRVLPGPRDIAAAVRGRMAASERENLLVVVRADARVPHAAVRAAMAAARDGGAMRLAVATRQGGRP